MKITMCCLGSTGDVRPYVLLGRELKKRGHAVTIATFQTFEAMARAEGLEFYAVAGDAVDFMNHLMKPGVNGVSFMVEVERAIRRIAPIMLRDLMKAGEGADAMVCTFFGTMYYSIAEKYHIPCIQTHYFPMDPNNAVPISSAPFQHLGKGWNSMTYKLGYLLIGTLEKMYLSQWRKEHDLPLRRVQTAPDYVSGGHTVPVIYAVSPRVMPRPSNWNEHIHMSGFWYDDQPCDFEPSQELKDFLAAGEKPVYIGFGSMASGDMRKIFAIVLKAVRAAKIRAIISTGWAEEQMHLKSTSRVFFANYVPHDWLFDHVSAVVHHGGAGTTAAGLRHGLPTLVVPFGGDQPFWGARIHALECGPKPIARARMTVDRLTRGLIDLVSQEKYRLAAEQMAREMRGEQGVIRAADLVEQEIQSWLENERKAGEG